MCNEKENDMMNSEKSEDRSALDVNGGQDSKVGTVLSEVGSNADKEPNKRYISGNYNVLPPPIFRPIRKKETTTLTLCKATIKIERSGRGMRRIMMGKWSLKSGKRRTTISSIPSNKPSNSSYSL